MSSSAVTTEPPPKDGFLYSAGPALASGAAQAIMFNPIDRALYVRVRYRRKRFLDWRNFERPFQGFFNAAVYRTLAAASYMFWQDSARIYIARFLPSYCQVETSPRLNSFIIGLFAGSVNGLALNTLQVVKFRMWNSDLKGVTFLRTAHLMYLEAGVPIFFRGSMTTMIRDSVFGVIYETTRRLTAWKDFFDKYVSATMECSWLGIRRPPPAPAVAAQEESNAPVSSTVPSSSGHSTCTLCAFMANLIAAIIASMLSSPFNYVRSVVYGTPPGAIPLGYWTLLRSFYTQFFYIWRYGRSYTDFYRIPKLTEVEQHLAHANATPVAAAVSRGDAAPGQRTPPTRPNGIRQPSGASAGTTTPKDGGATSVARARLRSWLRLHHHHPIAACKWANTRLNIGWGSIRVGLGMAISQSLFHITQDFARERSSTRRAG